MAGWNPSDLDSQVGVDSEMDYTGSSFIELDREC
jgi:hypothetical protein